MKKLLPFVFLCWCFPGSSQSAHDALSGQAAAFKQAGNYTRAIQLYREILQRDINSGDLKLRCKNYNNLANVYCDIGNYDKSTSLYFQALKMAEQIADAKLSANIYYNIANNYRSTGKLNYSVDFLNKAINQFTGEKSHELILGLCFTMLGGISTDNQEYLKALGYLQKAEKLLIIAEQPAWLANVYTNLSFLFLEIPDYKLGTQYARKALMLYYNENDPIGVAASYINLAKAQYHMTNPNNTVNKKGIYEAIQYLDSATSAITKSDSPETCIAIFKNKQELYTYLNQYDSAYIYQTKYLVLNDSVHAIEKNKQLDELKVQYDVDKKEQENLLLQKTAESRYFLIMILGVLVLAIVIVALLIFRQNKLQNQQRTVQLEQKLLRLQMNPHFIFNALEAIQNFTIKNKGQEATKYLSVFGNLTRAVLENSRNEFIPLYKEIALLQDYLDLQKLLAGSKFNYEINVSQELDTGMLLIPPMISQPFIENAIEHGFQGIEEGGLINISFSKSDRNLLLEIKDNGQGISPEDKKQHQSLATTITRERIFLLNKKSRHRSSFTIAEAYPAEPRKGLKVTLTLPLIN